MKNEQTPTANEQKDATATTIKRDLIRLSKAAKLAHVQPVTLLDWARKGRLPIYHVGPHTTLVSESDVVALILSSCVSAATPASNKAA